MFRIIPHRALIEPKASIAGVAPSRASLRVDGLLCSACAANVRGRLESLAGVTKAEVDLDTAEARVEYDAGEATPDDLIAAVEGAVILRPLRRLLASVSGHRRGM